jgi:predicted transcriptional regulator
MTTKANTTPSKSIKSKMEEKWGVEIKKNGFTQIPTILLEKQHALGINSTELVIILNILKHWWEADKKPYPGVKGLADAMGLQRNTVQKGITRLEQMGLIKRIQRFSKNSKGQMSNEYSFDGLIKHLKSHAASSNKLKANHKNEADALQKAKKAK